MILESVSLIAWGAITARFFFVGVGVAVGFMLPLLIEVIVDKCEAWERRRAIRLLDEGNDG